VRVSSCFVVSECQTLSLTPCFVGWDLKTCLTSVLWERLHSAMWPFRVLAYVGKSREAVDADSTILSIPDVNNRQL